MSHFQIKGYASVCIEVLVTRVRQIQPHIKLGSYYSYDELYVGSATGTNLM